MCVGDSAGLAHPEQASAWGIGRVLAHQRAPWAGLLDLPEVLDERMRGRLCRVLAGCADENQVAVRPSGVFVPRLVRAARRVRTGTGWTPRGTVLVDGVVDRTGARIARSLAHGGAEHLLLTHSQADTPVIADLVADLATTGTRVTVEPDPGTGRDDLRDLLAEHQPTAVVAVDSTPEAVAALDELTRDSHLDAFVVLCALGATLGFPDQPADAARHAVLSALVWQRHQAGVPATAVACGPWSHDDRAADTGERLTPESVLTELRWAVPERQPFLVLTDIDWRRYEAAEPAALLRELCQPHTPEPGADQPVAATEPETLLHRLAGLDRTAADQVLLDVVRSLTATVLGHATPAAIPPDADFLDLGFASLTAIELANRLTAATGLELSPSLVYEHPTPLDVVAHLRAELGEQPRREPETPVGVGGA